MGENKRALHSLVPKVSFTGFETRVPVRSGWVAQRGVSTRPSRVVGLDRVGRVLGGYGAKTPGRVAFAKPNFYWLKIKIGAIIFLSYFIDRAYLLIDKPYLHPDAGLCQVGLGWVGSQNF